MCRSCVAELRRGSSKCPTCRASFASSRLTSQPFVQSMVWQLRVRCVQHDKGCGWQVQLGVEARNLLAHNAVCTFKAVSCPLCNETHLLKDTQQHQASCPRRQLTPGTRR